ncbi:MAG: DEAD/DEAH box helicase [Bifidobacteriaceae bacterium]|jgi:ATP-dependent DNA helicase RecG|nr:DEAD/DEAH box helicase [Bifidobacteriaceae bacterium]
MLDVPISKFVYGKSKQSVFKNMGIQTIKDALYYFPYRMQTYKLYENITDAKYAKMNASINDDYPALKLFITGIKYKNSEKYFDLTVDLTDGKSSIRAYWITKSLWYRDLILEEVKNCDSFYIRGNIVKTLPSFRRKVDWIVEEKLPIKNNYINLNIAENSDTYFLFPEVCSSLKEALKPKPIYHAKSVISTRVMSKTLDKIFEYIKTQNIPNIVPEIIRANNNLYSRRESFYAIHKPNSMDEYNKGVRSVIFEEAWTLHIPLLAKRKTELKNQKTLENQKKSAKNIKTGKNKTDKKDKLLSLFDNSFDFQLTQSQKEVSKVLDMKLKSGIAEKRLLQGDTASGKTIVALRQMINFAIDGYQSALLAPTLVIAWQHYYTIKAKLESLYKTYPQFPEIGVELITGNIKGKQRKAILEKLKDNKLKIIIGTTALLNIEDEFANLKLLIIDEQHKYGVTQRNSIGANKESINANQPHLISMSATPIPRSVALSVFADYEIDTLEKPELNCSNIFTKLVSAKNQEQINSMKNNVLKEIKSGNQAIIVVPRIEENPITENIYSIYNEYAVDERFQDCTIELIHGRLKPADKIRIMDDVHKGKIDLLISTTVIEVGVDIKKASTIAIYNANNFSISQLHQLRGRVGRDKTEVENAYCYLIHSTQANTPQREKLEAVRDNLDGFTLSKIDLRLRGEGDILGYEQSGKKSNLKIMRILKDIQTLELSLELARKYIDSASWSWGDIETLEKEGQKIYLETNEFLNKI